MIKLNIYTCSDIETVYSIQISCTLDFMDLFWPSNSGVGSLLWRKPENPPAQFKNTPVESQVQQSTCRFVRLLQKQEYLISSLLPVSSLYPYCWMRDKENEYNQPKPKINLPIWDWLLGTLIAYLACHLIRQISSLRDLGDSYYMVCIALNQTRNYK